MQEFIIFQKIQFIKAGQILKEFLHITLPEAIEKAQEINPIKDNKINIQVFYY